MDREEIIKEIKSNWTEKLRQEWVGLSDGESTLDGNFSIEELKVIIESMLLFKIKLHENKSEVKPLGVSVSDGGGKHWKDKVN